MSWPNGQRGRNRRDYNRAWCPTSTSNSDALSNHGGNPHGVCLCSTTACREDELAGGQVKGHTLRLHEVKPGRTLLGNHSQFCHAYWHMSETPEAPHIETPCCLRASSCADREQCAGKGVVLVARLQSAPSSQAEGTGEPLYIARYSNCPDNEHAETFFLRDTHLQDALPSAKGGVLMLYLNKQPCHHSSDHLRGKSCTADLLKFAADSLRPLGITLEVVITYTYRAHWELCNLSHKLQQRYGPAIHTAREGIRRFYEQRRHGVILRAFQGSDWCWLVGYCDPDVRNGYLSALASDSYGACAGKSDMQRPSVGQTVFTNDKIRARDAMDKYVQQVIDRWSRTS